MLKHIIKSFILFSCISVTAQIEIKRNYLTAPTCLLFLMPLFSSIKTGVISNEFGEFTLKINRSVNASDSLNVSCLGYENTAVSLKNFDTPIIYLNPQYIDLEQVNINEKNWMLNKLLIVLNQD